MTNRQLLEQVIKDIANLRKEVSLLRDDMDVLDQVVGKMADVETQSVLAQRKDERAKKDLAQEMQWQGDKIKAAVETQVESIKDDVKDIVERIDDKKFQPKKKGWLKKLYGKFIK
jgi:fumarylacetoacetate (FAA) hydrolase family protein